MVLGKVTDWLVLATLVAIIGGFMSVILGYVFGAVYTVVGFQTILGGIFALILLIIVAAETDLDGMAFFDIVILLIAVGLVGSIIVTIVPLAAPYILNVSITQNWVTGIAWSLVYIGLALLVKEQIGWLRRL